MQYLISGSTIITIANIANVRVVEFPNQPPEHRGRKYYDYTVDATETHANRRYTLYEHDSRERYDAFLEAYGALLNSANKVVTIRRIRERMRPVPDYYNLRKEQDRTYTIRLVLETARDTLKSQLEALAQENGLTPDWDGIHTLRDDHNLEAYTLFGAYTRAVGGL